MKRGFLFFLVIIFILSILTSCADTQNPTDNSNTGQNSQQQSDHQKTQTEEEKAEETQKEQSEKQGTDPDEEEGQAETNEAEEKKVEEEQKEQEEVSQTKNIDSTQQASTAKTSNTKTINTTSTQALSKKLFQLINSKRTKTGLKPFSWDTGLANIANARANAAAAQNNLHTSINDSNYSKLFTGIAKTNSINSAYNQMINLSQVLSSEYTNAGIATKESPKYGYIFVCVIGKIAQETKEERIERMKKEMEEKQEEQLQKLIEESLKDEEEEEEIKIIHKKDMEQAAFAEINRIRKEAGTNPLVWNEAAAQEARAKAKKSAEEENIFFLFHKSDFKEEILTEMKRCKQYNGLRIDPEKGYVDLGGEGTEVTVTFPYIDSNEYKSAGVGIYCAVRDGQEEYYMSVKIQ